MNHLGYSYQALVGQLEVLQERFEGAVIAHVSEVASKHVKPHSARMCFEIGREYKFGFGVDKMPDQPCRSDAIHFGTRASLPGTAMMPSSFLTVTPGTDIFSSGPCLKLPHQVLGPPPPGAQVERITGQAVCPGHTGLENA